MERIENNQISDISKNFLQFQSVEDFKNNSNNFFLFFID